MCKGLKTFLSIFFILFLSLKVDGQTMTTSFVDPCTKSVTTFTIPIQGGTVIYFYGQSRTFTAADVASGEFANWINQVYSDYRKISPCSVQSTNVIRNQITSQVIGNVVSSIAGAIASEAAGNLVIDKPKSSDNSKNKSKNESRNNPNSNTTSNSGNIGSGGSPNGLIGGNQNNSQNSQNNNNPVGGGVSSSSTSTQTGSQNSQQTSTTSDSKDKNSETSEVAATTQMNVDARNDKGSDNEKGGGKGGSKSVRNNPIVVSSDLTSAQNLDKSFTGIINVGMSQSSMTGTSSWGVTSMVWFNLKQFALNGRYTKIHFSNNGKLKWVHNINATALYSYGNYMGFIGYSAILNAGKFGVTGMNVSGMITKVTGEKNLFISPSVTAFYTKPFKAGNKLTVSPELYIISTPLVYSSFDKVTVSDRTFSGFLGSGFDYQLTRRFKFNLNYKANMSTNSEFPILSFFLIGSKINL
jgi:hypothetical protein